MDLNLDEFVSEVLRKVEQNNIDGALKLLQEAEDKNERIRDPEFALEIGGCYFDLLKDSNKALQNSFKAKEFSQDEVNPEASFLIGLIYQGLGDFEKSLRFYSEAESISSDGKFPDASYNKGTVLNLIGNHDAAIDCFTKAEIDSSPERYPNATFNKGVIYYDVFGDKEKGFEYFDLAERFSVNNVFPQASYMKGWYYFHEADNLELALKYFDKAEKESYLGVNPEASYKKGVVLCELGLSRQALISFTKAEFDSSASAHMNSSNSKGDIYLYLNQETEALHSYNKSINDWIGSQNVNAYIGRSKAYLLLGNRPLAKEDAYTALLQNSRSQKAIQNVLENFASSEARTIYESRIKYLDYKLGQESILRSKIESDFGKHPLLLDTQSADESRFLLLCLSSPSILDKELESVDALRTAYLLSYQLKLFHISFYIIDELIDGHFPLVDLDLYFYLLNAIHIGEPISEIEYYSNSTPNDPTDGFGREFHLLSNKVKIHIKERMMLDPYLLEISKESLHPSTEYNYKKDEHHIWIQSLLNAIFSQEAYELPLSTNELNGLFSRLLFDVQEAKITTEVRSLNEWNNFVDRLELRKYDRTQVENIKQCITKGVPYEVLLGKLFLSFDQADNHIDRHNIVLLQAVVMILAKRRRTIENKLVTNGSKTVLSCLSDLYLEEVIGTLLAIGLASTIGISLASSFIVGKVIDKINSNIHLDKQLDKLISELI